MFTVREYLQELIPKVLSEAVNR